MPGPDALAKQLGAPPPPGLVAALADEDLDRLASRVREARDRQVQALMDSGDDALRLVPVLLRRPVRRIVGLG